MLKNIKSKHILRIVFEKINYDRKLNITKYNKLLQTRLNLTTEDYIINLIKQKLKKIILYKFRR